MAKEKKFKVTFRSSSASKEEGEAALKRAFDVLFSAILARRKKDNESKKLIKK